MLNREWCGPTWQLTTRIRWYRGFIETIELLCADFWPSVNAAAIFNEHPVTVVNLLDREPRWPENHVVGFTWMPTPEDDPFEHAQSVREGDKWSPTAPPWCLPWPIFYFVEAARVNNIAKDAEECLSRGCVIYGREKAGLRE